MFRVHKVIECSINTHGSKKPCVLTNNKVNDDDCGGLSFEEILKKEIEKDEEKHRGNE